MQLDRELNLEGQATKCDQERALLFALRRCTAECGVSSGHAAETLQLPFLSRVATLLHEQRLASDAKQVGAQADVVGDGFA